MAVSLVKPMAHDRTLVMWRTSQFSIKAVAALALKGLLPERDYKVVSVPLDIKLRSKLLPHPSTVPAMRQGAETVLGSDHICAFLDEQHPSDAHQFYPPAIADEVRRIEKQIADLYWHNGYLSLVDAAGFERFSGSRARKYVRSNVPLGAPLVRWAPSLVGKLIRDSVRKDWIKTVQGRGGEHARLATIKDAAIVYREARAMLAALEEELGRSPTPYFCGADGPTAADLTLYGMLERWLGDSLLPGETGAAQPDILEGYQKLGALWADLRGRFSPAVNLSHLNDYQDITEPWGQPTFPRKPLEPVAPGE